MPNRTCVLLSGERLLVSEVLPLTISSPEICKELRARTPPGKLPEVIAQRDLARYCRLLRQELATIDLSQQEAMLIWYALVRVREAGRSAGAFPSLAAAVQSEWRALPPSCLAAGLGRAKSDRPQISATSG